MGKQWKQCQTLIFWAPKSLQMVTAAISPLDCKEIKPVNPKRNQPLIFTGRTDAENEALIVWPRDVKSRLIRKDPKAGKD